MLILWGACLCTFAQTDLSQTNEISNTFSNAFPEGDPLKIITAPIFIGKQAISERINRQIIEKGNTHSPLGLVLCGGSARAYAHIGVLKALEASGIYPDFIVASSMGAIVGMLYAVGFSPDDIQYLIHAIPLESYFNIVIPTNGGFINTDTFRSVLRAIIGDLDISQTKIPIIVTAEDLRTRQQIWIAEGPFDRAMTSAFAMPAIFEPQQFDRYALIDAGATTIAPVEPAVQFTDRLIVSTAFYDRLMNFSSPITVINRSVDIGKTRAGMQDIEKSGAFVIRNDVENLSYMQFSDPDIIIAKGEQSARKAIDALSPDAKSLLINPPLKDFLAQRDAIHDSMMRNIQQMRSGYMPSISFLMRGVPLLELFEPFNHSAGETWLEPRVGASLAIFVSRFRASFSYFAALNQDPGKEWAIEGMVHANPKESLNVWLTGRLWGAYNPTSFMDHSPQFWEIAVLERNSFPGSKANLSFQIGGDIMLNFNGTPSMWKIEGLAKTNSVREFSRNGPALQPWHSAKAGGFIENTTSTQIAWGAEAIAIGGFESKWVSPNVRAFAKVSLNKNEYAEDEYDGFRSDRKRGDVLSSLVTNVEVAFSPQEFYLDVAEAILLRKFKVGPFFDTCWNSALGQNFHLSDWATGLALSFEARAFGLAPAILSFFGSYSDSKLFTFQFRTGILFSPQ